MVDTTSAPLLTAEEETALAERIQAGLQARQKIKTALPAEKPLYEHSIQDGKAATEEMVERNFGLASWVVLKHVSSDDPDYEDLTQEARWGLFIAARRFDPQKGFRFATYATWWLRQRVQRYIAERKGPIHIPAHIHGRLVKMSKVKRALATDMGRKPTLEEIADYMGVRSESLSDGLNAQCDMLSLDTPLSPEDERVLADVVGDPDDMPSGQQVDESFLQAKINEAVGGLPPRLAKVVRLHYGLNDNRPRIVKEVGRELKISRQRAEQLLAGHLLAGQNSRSRPLRPFVNGTARRAIPPSPRRCCGDS